MVPTVRVVSLALIAAASGATPAFADLGHIEDAGHGHSHWLAVALIAAAVAAVVAGVLWLRRRLANKAQKQRIEADV